MLKLIAILVLSSHFSVAVETDNGWIERAFPNTAAGAQQLVEFAEANLGEPPSPVRVTVGWLDDEVNDDHIISFLAEAGIKHGLTTPEDIKSAAAANGIPEISALAVAHADIRRFGFLYRSPK